VARHCPRGARDLFERGVADDRRHRHSRERVAARRRAGCGSPAPRAHRYGRRGGRRRARALGRERMVGRGSGELQECGVVPAVRFGGVRRATGRSARADVAHPRFAVDRPTRSTQPLQRADSRSREVDASVPGRRVVSRRDGSPASDRAHAGRARVRCGRAAASGGTVSRLRRHRARQRVRADAGRDRRSAGAGPERGDDRLGRLLVRAVRGGAGRSPAVVRPSRRISSGSAARPRLRPTSNASCASECWTPLVRMSRSSHTWGWRRIS
jgi:hypothetical protein